MGLKKMRVLKKNKANHFFQISIAMYGKYKNLKQIEIVFNNYNTPSIDYNYFQLVSRIYTKLILRVHFIFWNDLLESSDEQINQEDEDNEKEDKHRQGRYPGPVCTAAGVVISISTGCKIKQSIHSVVYCKSSFLRVGGGEFTLQLHKLKKPREVPPRVRQFFLKNFGEITHQRIQYARVLFN